MIVAIAGAHGGIATRLARLLADGGDNVIGLIRNPDHAADVSGQGASPVVCDLELASVEEIAQAIPGAAAAVFAAGAGPGSGAERKLTLDRDGAIKFLRAATEAGVRRFVIVSAIGAEAPFRATMCSASTCGRRLRPTKRCKPAISSGRSSGPGA
jgi:nucleoside-diphosphate-sugar epimerase